MMKKLMDKIGNLFWNRRWIVLSLMLVLAIAGWVMSVAPYYDPSWEGHMWGDTALTVSRPALYINGFYASAFSAIGGAVVSLMLVKFFRRWG